MNSAENRHALALLFVIGMSLGCEAEDPSPTTDEKPSPAAVSVGVMHHSPDPLVIQLDGSTLRIEQFVVVFGVTELHLCEEAAGWSPIPRAYAHVPSTGTRLGTVFAEDLTSPAGAARIVGEFEPIHGDYCTATLVAAPADDDVLNLSSVPTSEVVGHSLVVSGELDGQQFRWTADAASLARVPLQRVSIGPGSSVQLLFDKRVDASTFDGILALPSDGERGRTVLRRVMETVERWSG